MRLALIKHLRDNPSSLVATIFAGAAVVAVVVAWIALSSVENLSKNAVDRALMLGGEDWATVDTNGLQVKLAGTAPNESARFHALSLAGGEVDSGRVIDQMKVPPAAAIKPPEFSIEMLRNEAGISMIGLVPAARDSDALAERVQKIDVTHEVTNLLETADYPVPELWDNALDFALGAVALLPRSKISIRASRVAIEANADSAKQKADWEKTLRGDVPGGVRLTLNISAPRPVITPFTLRFTIDGDGARFDACTAHTEAGLAKIVAAGIAAGVKGKPDCIVALGVPSPDWPDAVSSGIAALHALGGGSLTFSDADISLIAAQGTPQNSFDRVIGELEAELPDVFSLHPVLPDPAANADAVSGPPEFTATLSPEGLVQLRGRIADEQERGVVESFARARFGSDNIYSAMRLDPDLPHGWSIRVLAALDALDQLANGAVSVQPTIVDISGATGDKGATAEISRILSAKLGEAEDFRVNVHYEKKFDLAAAVPTPEECVAAINAAMADKKITFSPGSADIDLASGRTLDKIAKTLKTCPDVAMEISGYTDSQGREEMNKALSQRRAEAVVSALLARRVLTSNLTAHGYGEENPIADNDTEAGREANRRIEFHLVGRGAAPGAPQTDAAGDTLRPAVRPDNGAANAAAAGENDTGAADAAPAEEDTNAAPDTTATQDAPVVVDPDLAGKRPKPRPAQGN